MVFLGYTFLGEFFFVFLVTALADNLYALETSRMTRTNLTTVDRLPLKPPTSQSPAA
jgi:hypothetical protein